MHGNDDIVEEDLYQGTAKSMEGVLSDECYEQAKVEGCCGVAGWGFQFSKVNFIAPSCISKNRFYGIIKLAYPHLKAIIDEIKDEEKEQMKSLAVMTSDGVWHTSIPMEKSINVGAMLVEPT